MRKSVKVALKRFAVLMICLLMVVPLLAIGDNLDKNAKIWVGVVALIIIAGYWIYAYIDIRRDKQRHPGNEKNKHD